MISFKQKGDFSNTEKYLKKLKKQQIHNIIASYGDKGVAALSAATPKETGKTATSWYYKVEQDSKSAKLVFYNSNIQNGVPIAIILQYGHGTGTGGWVEGRDYINPAIRPIFDDIAKKVWEEVTKT